ncbi:MAG TPA: tetratricopeptide repeat protein, partial [Chthoniobacterales bacterium]|nr:tetratricopeptide repeat protein [Chthoniobacterales bacterium]
MSVEEQRKLAGIMFTDMVGYSALSQRDDRLAQELLEEHRELLRKIFPEFNGSEIKTIGDAFLVEFNSALEAAQCAIEIQRALAHRNHDVATERRIEVKIGIHIGDVVHRGGDVYGDGVNIASRIEPLAGPGGICVSMDVERQIHNALEARLEKLKPTELKNISVPMDLFRIVLPWEQRQEAKGQKSEVSKSAMVPVLIGALVLLFVIAAGWWWTTQSHISPSSSAAPSAARIVDQKSIAVLPFENLSHDPDNAYFADGVQEEILTRLSKIADLKVISRTSTQRYKTAPDNLREIAQQLGVANILEGTVQKAADQVRVNVQLINALTDSHLWADEYDRKLTDIFTVESEVAAKIANTLQARLTGAEQKAIAVRPTENSEAHELYLRGRFYWNRSLGPAFFEKSFDKSREYYEKALQLDPTYALAYAGLADYYGFAFGFGLLPPEEKWAKAQEDNAKKALELDPTLGEAYNPLAADRLYVHRDWPGAERDFRRGLELSPNFAEMHAHYSMCLVFFGRNDEALSEVQRALALDPLSPRFGFTSGRLRFFMRQYDAAIEQYRKTLELDPNFPPVHESLGDAYEKKGMQKEAIAEWVNALTLTGEKEEAAILKQTYATSGFDAAVRKAAQKKLEGLNAKVARGEYVPAAEFVKILM